jgi:hypothetical protein
MFLSQLNDLEFWSNDVGNAYLKSKTDEKVYIVAGSKFWELGPHPYN